MFAAYPELDHLLTALTRRDALIEAAALALALLLAAGLVALLRQRVLAARAQASERGADPSPLASIWFGRALVDGVLFPTLALALAYLVRHLLRDAGVTLALFRVAIPVLLSLALIRLSVRVLTVAFPDSRWMRLVERTISWIAWAAVVMWVTGVLPAVMEGLDEISWKMGSHSISLRTLIEGTLSAGFVLMLSLWISAALEARLLAGVQGAQLSLRKAAANALRALLMFVGLLVALSAVGIDLTAFSVIGGALGVGIGFGLQKLAANYVSGFVILAERSVHIGDLVRVADFEGRITDITTRYTVIRAVTGREAIVPNEVLITTTVQNLTLSDTRLLLSSNVVVAHGTDVDALMPQLAEGLVGVPRVLADPAPAVHLRGFANIGLELSVNVWIGDPENGQGNVLSDVNLKVLAMLRERGIEIPRA